MIKSTHPRTIPYTNASSVTQFPLLSIIKQRCHSIMVKHRIQQCDDQKTWNCQEKVDLQDLSHSVQPHGICSSSHKRHCQINRMLDKHGKPQHHGKIKEIQNGMASGEGISHNTDPPHPMPRLQGITPFYGIPGLPAYTWSIHKFGYQPLTTVHPSGVLATVKFIQIVDT